MKLKQLSAAVLATTALVSGAYAQEAPTVYGKVNVSLQQTDIEDANGDTIQDNWTMESNASRIGVKGSAAINDTLSVIYKAEYEIYVDDGDDGSSNSSEFNQRNIYGGLQGNFGTVIFGKHDTPTKLAQGKIDRFNDLMLGDIKNIFEGENRESNIVIYTTPSFSGFSGSVAFMPGEDSGAAGNDENDGLADHISAAVSYENDTVYVAFAADDNVDQQDLMRLVGDFKFGMFTIGAMWQETESTDTALYGDFEESGYLLSGEVKVGENGAIKLQYGENEREVNNTTTNDWSTTSVGYDHKIGKATKLFAYYTMNSDDEATGTTPEDASTFGVGMEHKF